MLYPYQMVKDLRTGVETSNVEAVLDDGDLDPFVIGYHRWATGNADAGGSAVCITPRGFMREWIKAHRVGRVCIQNIPCAGVVFVGRIGRIEYKKKSKAHPMGCAFLKEAAWRIVWTLSAFFR